MVRSTNGLVGSTAYRHTSEKTKESCPYREFILNENERRETPLRESSWSCVRKTDNCASCKCRSVYAKQLHVTLYFVWTFQSLSLIELCLGCSVALLQRCRRFPVTELRAKHKTMQQNVGTGPTFIRYSKIISTNSLTLCMTTFNASLTNLNLLAPELFFKFQHTLYIKCE